MLTYNWGYHSVGEYSLTTPAMDKQAFLDHLPTNSKISTARLIYRHDQERRAKPKVAVYKHQKTGNPNEHWDGTGGMTRLMKESEALALESFSSHFDVCP